MGKGRGAQEGGHRRVRRRVAIVGGGSALALALAAAVVVLTKTESQPDAVEAGPAASRSPAVARPAPSSERAHDFILQTVDGDVFSLADQRGRVVVVEFLAPGCPECLVDVAGLGQTAVERKRDVRILIADVSGLGDPRGVRDYYRGNLGAPRELLIAEDGGFAVAQAYGVVQLGETVVIGPDGRVSWQGRWSGDHTRLLDEIERASVS